MPAAEYFLSGGFLCIYGCCVLAKIFILPCNVQKMTYNKYHGITYIKNRNSGGYRYENKAFGGIFDHAVHDL